MKIQKITSPRAFVTIIHHWLQLKDHQEDKPVYLSDDSGRATTEQNDISLWKRLLPMVLLLAMAGAIFLLDAVFPLQGLGFFSALLPESWSWTFWPTHMLFPHQADVPLIIPARQPFSLSFSLLAW